MKTISSMLIVGDDVAIATLSNGKQVQLGREVRDGNDYYKVRQGNKIYPVGTRMSGIQFSEKTTWTIK